MSRRQREMARVGVAALGVLAISAFAAVTGHGDLTNELIASCSANVSYVEDVRVDATGSSKNDGLDDRRLAAIVHVFARAAACGDRVRIAASTCSALFPSGRCRNKVSRVERSTRVPTALRLPSPRTRSPSSGLARPGRQPRRDAC